MPLVFFLKGFLIGLSIAAPVGPIGILCIRRSATEGPRMGFATGLGAATADAAYGAVAAFGLTSISMFLVNQRFWFQLIGGVFLCYLGVQSWRSRPQMIPERASKGNPSAAYIGTFFLTLANPATILSFVAVFAGFGLADTTVYSMAAPLVAGVFSGSALWWLILSQGVGHFSSRLGSDWALGINRVSGCVLFAFGAIAIAVALHNWPNQPGV